jgi:hypothetical protein
MRFVECDVRGPDMHHAEIIFPDALRPFISHSSAPIISNLFESGLPHWSLGIIDGTDMCPSHVRDGYRHQSHPGSIHSGRRQ